MSDLQCGAARELIPDLVGGRLASGDAASVQEHLTSCAECRAEVELAQLIFASRADVPSELADRVVAAVHSGRVGSRRPWWGITAAAVAALALGIGIVSEPSSELEPEVPGYAYEVEEGALWLSDDGLLAGAPSLDALSDEALEQLLDELLVGAAGGSA